MESEEMIRILEEIIRNPDTNATARCTAIRTLREFPQQPEASVFADLDCTRTTLSFAVRVATATIRLSNERTPGTPVHHGSAERSHPRRPPELPVEEIPDEEWRPIGEMDPVTGRSTLDLEKASGWRPLGEFLWRR